MAERIACEFQLVRYVPDAVRGEFATIGVILREADGGRPPLLRFSQSWTRLRRFDPDADVPMLQALEGELQRRLAEDAGEQRPLLEVLTGSWSNQLQLSDARASLAESAPAEMDRLMHLYVDAVARPSPAREGGRAAIAAAMRRAFERAAVWPLLRKSIPASEYTAAGDPLRIDCGYRPNGTVRMFQAVSLAGEMEGAKVLAYASRELHEGVLRKEGATLELTAVMMPLGEGERQERGEESYRFARTMMEREAIRVITTSDLVRVAERARQELKV